MSYRDYDYGGEMSYYQDQLTKAGISKERFDMGNYVGLTARELQGIVNSVISQVRAKEAEKRAEGNADD